MLIKRSLIAPLFLFLFVSCNIDLGEEVVEESSGPNIVNEEVNDITAEESNIMAIKMPGKTVDLSPVFIFEVRNRVDKPLHDIYVELGAGEMVEKFAYGPVNMATKSGVRIKKPTFIIDNTIYITLKGPKGKIRERHLLHSGNCSIDSCNKIILTINEQKYSELIK
tara:strand:- start:133 stop:630 length:498 start_codon:yes stop_codon:yes gene_type:complete